MEIETGLGAAAKVFVVVCTWTSRRNGGNESRDTKRQHSRGGPALPPMDLLRSWPWSCVQGPGRLACLWRQDQWKIPEADGSRNCERTDPVNRHRLVLCRWPRHKAPASTSQRQIRAGVFESPQGARRSSQSCVRTRRSSSLSAPRHRQA